MEPLPLFIGMAVLFLWALIGLFFSEKVKASIGGIGFFFALVELGCAIWSTVLFISSKTTVGWEWSWLAFSSKDALSILFVLSPAGIVFWMALSIVLVAFMYFTLIGRFEKNRGNVFGFPLLALGVLFIIFSENMVVFYFGLALAGFSSFLMAALSSANSSDRARNSFRYLIFNLFSEILLLCSLIGIFSSVGSLKFADINAKAASIPAWVTISMVVAILLRNIQIPMIGSVRFLANAKENAYPIFILGHVLVSSLFFSKLQVAVSSSPYIPFLALIPAVTAVYATVMAVSERDVPSFVGWVTCYLLSSVFLTGLSGSYLASQALGFTGAMTLLLFAIAMHLFEEKEPHTEWFLGIAVVSLGGCSLFGFGWAQYLEYFGLLRQAAAFSGSELAAVQWVAISFKFLADFLLAMALWGFFKEMLGRTNISPQVRWEVVLPLGLLGLGQLSLFLGGRPLGGVLGEVSFEPIQFFSWFEPFIKEPEHTMFASLIGDQADYLARGFVLGAFLLSPAFSLLVPFRDKIYSEKFLQGWNQFLQKVKLKGSDTSLIWDWVFKPVFSGVSRAADFFDSKVLDYSLSDMWDKPLCWTRKGMAYFEAEIMDKKIVDGAAVALASVSKALKLVQNGQVQFYFGIGLLLMVAFILKFIFTGA